MQRGIFEKRLAAERSRRSTAAIGTAVSTGVKPLSAAQSEAYAAAVAMQCSHWQSTCAAAAAARQEARQYPSGALSIPKQDRQGSQVAEQVHCPEGQTEDKGREREDSETEIVFEAFCDEGLKRAASFARFQRAARTVIFKCCPAFLLQVQSSM
jgi:hypothetical protein